MIWHFLHADAALFTDLTRVQFFVAALHKDPARLLGQIIDRLLIDAQQVGRLKIQCLFRQNARIAPLVERKRSEEHTSELQSLMRTSYAVFCLKNKKLHEHIHIFISSINNLTCYTIYYQNFSH